MLHMGSTTYLAKYNSSGVELWKQSYSTISYELSLTEGSDNSIYIAGSEYSSTELDGQQPNGYGDTFISKSISNGAKEWTKLIGTGASDRSEALATSSDGSIYIAGYTFGDLDGQTNSGNEDAYLMKLKEMNAPSDITLSTTSFDENIGSNVTIATLSSTDDDTSDTHTYSLVSGIGDTDNSSFTIDGTNLNINSSPDYETKSSYSIRTKTTDSSGLSYEKNITLSVNDLDDVSIFNTREELKTAVDAWVSVKHLQLQNMEILIPGM